MAIPVIGEKIVVVKSCDLVRYGKMLWIWEGDEYTILATKSKLKLFYVEIRGKTYEFRYDNMNPSGELYIFDTISNIRMNKIKSIYDDTQA